jgi:hypothetical protein
MTSRNPLVADDPEDLDPDWEAELDRRMREGAKGGGYKGQKGGGYKGRDYKGGEKGYQQPKGKGKGKGSKSRESSQSSKGGKPGGGKGGGWGARGAAGYAAAWAGWGAKGGSAAATHPEENDNEGSWTLLALSIVMMLLGALFMTKTFRRPAAHFLRKLASMIDEIPVSEAVGRALHDHPAVAGAMPQRRRPEDETSSIGTQTDTAERNAPDLNVGARAVHKLFWLEKMTVYELKTHCRDEGLAVSGTKADLIWRIEHHRAMNFTAGGGVASAM